jgi:hypothetical protein
MLIVEGADLVGKSTFCEAAARVLADRGLLHDLHHDDRPEPGDDYYHRYRSRRYVFSLWDRYHLGELAYRAFDDRPSTITPLAFDLAEAGVRECCGFVIVITAEEETLRQRFALGKKKELYDLERILKVNERYMEIVRSSGRTLTLRGKDYHPRVDYWIYDAAGADVERVVEIYARQLREYGELTR